MDTTLAWIDLEECGAIRRGSRGQSRKFTLKKKYLPCDHEELRSILPPPLKASMVVLVCNLNAEESKTCGSLRVTGLLDCQGSCQSIN